MKVIDLLNKIANGEASDLTTRFIFRKKEYSFYSLNHSDYCLDRFLLNQEVEIIEEDKKIEKLEQRTDTGLIGTDSTDMIEHTNRINRQAGYLSEIVSKINEIIDVINKGD